MDGGGGRPGPAARLVGIDSIIPHRLLALGRKVEQCGGDEVRCLEDLEVALGGVVALGAVDDGLAGGIPRDLLQREGMAQQILGEALASCVVTCGNQVVAAVVDVEAGMFPAEQVGKLSLADEFLLA